MAQDTSQGTFLFSTHCPKCKVLERKLQEKNIPYTEISDVAEIEKTGFKTVPLLKVDDKILEFSEAIKWVRDYAN